MDSIKLQFNTPKPKKLNTVFIIEDNPVERSMLLDFFEKYPSLVVKGFLSGDACIKEIIMSKVSPDLILVDYFLDSDLSYSKDGLEIIAKIKDISPYTEFIMLTSVDNEKIMDLARRKGVMGYVVKGVSSYEMLDSILQKKFTIEGSPDSNS
jgi:two-component system, NarL family, response regulator LiaR